jgi:hypothetical protein
LWIVLEADVIELPFLGSTRTPHNKVGGVAVSSPLGVGERTGHEMGGRDGGEDEDEDEDGEEDRTQLGSSQTGRRLAQRRGAGADGAATVDAVADGGAARGLGAK